MWSAMAAGARFATPGARATLEHARLPKTDADSLSSVFGSPAFFIGRAHPAVRTQMLVFPFAIHLDIFLLVTHGKKTKKIPCTLRTVPLDFDDRIHHHVVREAEALLGPLEQPANRLMAL